MTKITSKNGFKKEPIRELVINIVIPLGSNDPDFTEVYSETSLDQLNNKFEALNNSCAIASWEVITTK